ncbi:glycosyltransferase [Neobacillus sp. 114]|uniref:glycosyltransferase n=1 Tax=Neobacillus sp. 114 TaxID=3048535 RepID=UPI0024C28D82|nr:glycosyltransferase [Neobacillus sp. 114]
MKVLVTDNAHLYKTPDGKYYTPSIYSYEFFKRYLNVFDEVRFVSKTKYVDTIDTSNFLLVSGKGLEIYELPWYQGIKGMLKNIFKLLVRYRKICDGCDCYIFRVSQIESYLAYIIGKRRGKSFAVEVVNDPFSFTDLKGIFKWINIRMLKHIVKKANGASYVTKNFLQGLYPNRAMLEGECERYFESYYSSIELTESDIRKPKTFSDTNSPFEIIHISNSINSNIKGHKTLIEALKIVCNHGYNITACCIGDGNLVSEFKRYAEELDVGDKVHFIGRLHSRQEVLDRLSKGSLFVFPTYTEGLPRAVIEAQAVGLPCISTPVAGIPELLDKRYLFEPEDSKSFAYEIMRLINNTDELEEMSSINIEVAKRYTKEKLNKRRTEFYSRLRKLAENEND